MNIVAGSLTVQPWTSKFLVKDNLVELQLNKFNFDVVLKNNNSIYTAVCNWVMDKNDLNFVKEFEIERSSDGRNFTEFYSILPNNNNSVFTAVDSFVFKTNHINYYRLKISDKENKINYSGIKVISKSKESSTLNI